MMRYEHVQHSGLYLIQVFAAIGAVVAAWFAPIPAVQVVLVLAGGIMLLFALSCKCLTVRDEGDHLLVQFGPLPLFRRRIPYADIERAVRGRAAILEGWGINLSPSGGWTWKLWGLDCVDVHLSRGRKMRIGSDDPDGLETFLRERTGQRE